MKRSVEVEVIRCLDTATVCRLAGVKQSTLDYWVRTRVVKPSLRTDPGKRRTRLWSVQDAVVVRTIAGLRRNGCPLPTFRKAKKKLDDAWGGLSADSTLFWTGADVVLVETEGHAVSLVKRPFQQVFRLIALPVGGWQKETLRRVSYIRTDNLARGIPAPTEEEAWKAL